MAKMLRLNDEEVEALRVKAVEINKILISKGKIPIRDSELVHAILKQSIGYVSVKPDGTIWVRGD